MSWKDSIDDFDAVDESGEPEEQEITFLDNEAKAFRVFAVLAFNELLGDHWQEDLANDRLLAET
ncbi:MAG: hypothetical protein KDA52_04995 [Planctomycetaceae bacterium]|nr:hypothetical protein [Planctomycetaceae bacterium]